MKNLAERIKHRLEQGQVPRGRYTFYLSADVVEGLRLWCENEVNGGNVSNALEELLREMVPPKYLEQGRQKALSKEIKKSHARRRGGDSA